MIRTHVPAFPGAPVYSLVSNRCMTLQEGYSLAAVRVAYREEKRHWQKWCTLEVIVTDHLGGQLTIDEAVIGKGFVMSGDVMPAGAFA